MHTKGPWTVGHNKRTVWRHVKNETPIVVICHVDHQDHPDNGDEIDNAKLIAAAPCLLAALTELVNCIEAEHHTVPGALNGLGEIGRNLHARDVEARKSARAAIAKAESK